MDHNESEVIKCIIVCITSILIFLTIILGIAIPCSISEKRNIEKEIRLKQIELYGEEINDNNKPK